MGPPPPPPSPPPPPPPPMGIVMVGVGLDPVRSGLVQSLARPGGNVTGVVTALGMELLAKRLQLLEEAVPKLSRAAVLSNPTNSGNVLAVSEIRVAAAVETCVRERIPGVCGRARSEASAGRVAPEVLNARGLGCRRERSR